MVGELVDEFLQNIISQSIERLELEDETRNVNIEDCAYTYATNFLKFALIRKINVMATRNGVVNRPIRH